MPHLRDRRWIGPAGRAGYVAKGVVYGLVGFLAYGLYCFSRARWRQFA